MITISNQSALHHRHMETLFSSVGDDLRHAVGTVGRVESSSTFPTIMMVPTKTIFMETFVCDDLELSSTHCCFCKDTCYTLANHYWDQQFIILPGIKHGGNKWSEFIDAEETSIEIDITKPWWIVCRTIVAFIINRVAITESCRKSEMSGRI